MIPRELELPVPRDISQVERLIVKNRALTKNLYKWALALIPALGLIFWLRWGVDDILPGCLIGAGITVLCWLWAWAMDLNTKRAIKLFRFGKVTTGTVVKLKAPADRGGNAYILTYVEYKTANGNSWKGQAMNSGHVSAIDHKVGDTVVVLYVEDLPKLFAIYTEGIGMSVGATKRTD